MDEIILNLLKQNGRVIIPDFGALIVKQKSPFTVIFNEFLQYNDGALIGAIQKELDIERDDAANKARDMAKELQEKLDRGDEITLNEIGILSKSSTGKISLRDLSLGETPPKQPDTPIIEEEKTSAVEFDLEENKTVEDIPSEKKVVEPEPEKVEEKVVEENNAKEDPVATKTPPTINDIHKNKAVKIEKETSVEATPPPITEYYGEGSGRKRLNLILWIIIIVIVNGAIIGFFLFNDEISGLFKGKNKEATPIESIITEEPEEETTSEEISVEDSIIATPTKELVIEETTEEPEMAEPAQESFAGTKYYVVAGVFGDENNADNLVKELKAKGYNAEKFGKIGKMHGVSYDVFPTKREADQLMLKIQKETDPGAWIKVID